MPVKIKNVMTTDVRSVREDTPVKEIARVLSGHEISAVPVLADHDEVVGLVSEADLLAKQVRPSRRGWFARRFGPPEGRTAADVMTAPAITIGQNATIPEAARQMTRYAVKRLPVVDSQGQLLGIVSRRDLIGVFTRPDDELRDEIVHDVLERTLCLSITPATVRVTVTDGVVMLDGEIDRKSLIPIAVAMIRRVDGVIDVTENLAYGFDDTHLPADPVNYGIGHRPFSP